MKTDAPFSEAYALDQSTNRYMLEIALSQYEDIFNEWDPAPFKRREIDADLELYLERSAEEIPFKYPIEIFFMLPEGARNQPLEEEIRSGLRSFFNFKLYFLKKESKSINVRMLRYIVFGFLLLWMGNTYPGHDSETDWAIVLTEGIFIGGWVFLWEAVSLFFFTNREVYHRRRICNRLLNAPVFFQELA